MSNFFRCEVFNGSYAVTGPADRHVPVDLRIPGCRPRPSEILQALDDLRKGYREEWLKDTMRRWYDVFLERRH